VIVLDASVVIAHFAVAGAHHDDATELLLRSAGERLVVHPLTVAEILVRPAVQGRELRQLERLQAMQVETWVMDAGAPLRLARLRASANLALPDCCVLDLALQLHGSIATFDERLARVAAGLGIDVIRN
jgi:predicted nucleic acid-binding protein